jgi:hypothetical protein
VHQGSDVQVASAAVLRQRDCHMSETHVTTGSPSRRDDEHGVRQMIVTNKVSNGLRNTILMLNHDCYFRWHTFISHEQRNE